MQLCFWGGQVSFFVVMALYLQQGRGLGPLPAGLIFTILAGAYVVASSLAAGLSARLGRGVIAAGALILACGHLFLFGAVAAIGVHGSLAALAPGLLLVGAGMGMGLVLAPLAATILQALRPEHAATASGMFTTVRNVGNSVGVAVTGVIFFGALQRGYAHAFELAVGELALLLTTVAALTALLSAKARAERARDPAARAKRAASSRPSGSDEPVTDPIAEAFDSDPGSAA